MVRWIVVGLGNPGNTYAYTRHNMGFMVVETMARELSLVWHEQKRFQALVAEYDTICMVKPKTFMNRSGMSVGEIVRFYKLLPENVIVIHDDLDIPFGLVKANFGKGPKIHNGLQSVEQYLKTSGFWRVRVGVDNRTIENRGTLSGEEYVLKPLLAEEREQMKDGLHAASQVVWEVIRGERQQQ